MARSKKEQSMIVTALGVQMTIWQNLVAAVRENGGSDEDIYLLATEDGQVVIEEMGKLIATSSKNVTEPKLETVTIAGYEFQQITYPDGGREIQLGEFEISYDALLAVKLAACKFDPDCVDGDITAVNFPSKEKGRKKIRLALINTGQARQDTRDFEAMTAKLGRIEGDLVQGLEVARRFPNLQRELYIIAFGSRHRGGAVVPVISSGYGGRHIGLAGRRSDWIDHGWALVAG